MNRLRIYWKEAAVALLVGAGLSGSASAGPGSWARMVSMLSEAQRPTQSTTPEKKTKIRLNKRAKKAKRSKKKKPRQDSEALLGWRLGTNWDFGLPVDAHIGSGYLDGWRFRQLQGGLIELEIGLTPTLRYRNGRVELRLPASHKRRETVDFSLTERRYRAGGELIFRPLPSFEFGAESHTQLVSRPDWPDLYQPVLDLNGNPTGRLEPTDRYSFFELKAQGFLRWRLTKNMFLTGYGGYLSRDYTEDPNYDGLEEPTHLVPGDKRRWRAGLRFSGKACNGCWRYLADARTEWIWYLSTYARDAQTGRIHPIPGQLPLNPLQRFFRILIRQRNSFWAARLKLRIIVQASYIRNQDLFDDYYTWNEFGAGLAFRLRPHRRLRLELGYTGSFRLYTQKGYQPGANHPPLDDNASIRKSEHHRVKARISYAVWSRYAKLFAEGRWSTSWTNFPDYRPFVFPSSRAYLIDWDTTNLALIGGVELEL